MSETLKTLAILGSTGSIGRQALSIVSTRPNLFSVFLLSCNSNYKLLYEQAKVFKPKHVVINAEAGYRFLKKNLNQGFTTVSLGMDSLCGLMNSPSIDLVLTAIVGSAGLLPTISAISAKKNIALANKETLVVAGELVMRLAKKNGVKVLPVDSEHSAIFQCLIGEDLDSVNKLILTASGGPFLNLPKNQFRNIGVKEALAHPNWAMGNKITIDSATLMNKGFELIEAFWLFGLFKKDIEVVIHPESIIHSLVEFVDGSMKAQLGLPSMTIPILYALGYPKRISFPFKALSLVDCGSLCFLKPDTARFPHLKLAYSCLKNGGTATCALNAANEVAVEGFLNGKLTFLNMFKLIEKSLEKSIFVSSPKLQDYLTVDNEVRKTATQLISKI
jgi:1-deoxy-D-xylulose-5-phosphate reductoisomerase